MELNDASFSGKISDFPEYLRSILAKVEGTFHTEKAEELGSSRLKYMKSFLGRIEKELQNEA
jgi:hypothetical protein